ncbi:hypothetical protein N7462_010274 [Penicillium macrosclerotiorum]|uniref:uncharacterized protein n=1 Tax=Penicillium macrosclerotiorum TaxID=303699 RepID=UPI0025494060|nr:uncharacterized protein N7462_010274 [Penicillium macrosclerotiorum]KAJ5669204.1 hypothetical protein N7462_010274 [Penicillium macrosclerotiorum]
MKSFFLHRGFGVALAAVAAISANVGVGEGNPLATSDQRDLDALAIELNQNYSFPVLKAEAKAAYQAAHGLPISDEASASLDAAIDELIFSAIQKSVNNDAYHPKVYWVDAGPRNWFDLDVPGGRYSYDNPDCIYRTIPIDDSLSYIVKGYRHSPGPADVTFSLISDPNSQNTVAYLSGSDLVVESDGSYTITINSSSADGATNHIQSTSSAKQLFVRNNLGNWLSEKPDNISVEIVEDTSSHAAVSISDIIATARWNLQESIVDYGVGALGIKTSINKVNTLSTPSQSSTLGTLTTQASSFGHFNLSDDEALVATLSPGQADYFVFPVTDPWMVTVDPSLQVSLNNEQAISNPNGTYTFVVSVQDPGVYNWINTTGLHEGTIMVRWQGLPESSSSSSTDSPSIDVQVISISELPVFLPDGTRWVTSEERASQLADRISGYNQRIEF